MMKKVPTPVPRLDSPDRYGPDYVLAALGVRAPDPSPGKSILRFLFLPSFHPECLLAVTDQEGLATIELLSMQTSLWYYGRHYEQKGSGKLDSHRPAPEEPIPWAESAALSTGDLDRLRLAIRTFVRSNPNNAPTAGLDGMTVRVEYWESGREPMITSAWSPLPGRSDDVYQLVIAAYRAASDRLTHENSQRLLESLFGYLRLGMPAKDLGGKPRVLRLFGRFSSDDEKDLQSFLSGIPPDEPLLMDLSNFEGMGTRLYPLFVQFARRPARTLWWASRLAQTPLRAIGIPPDCVVGTREDALRKLAARCGSDELPPL